jgi:2OG-Fe(II) oxygenase superfamily
MDHDEFQPHFDATTRIGINTSLLTVLIYLNTGGGVDFAGGDTLFLNHNNSLVVGGDGRHTSATFGSSSNNSNNNKTDTTPVPAFVGGDVVALTPAVGSVVIFEHDLYHASTPLTWGTKYVLRTDVLFHLEQDPKEKQFQKLQQQQQQQQEQPEFGDVAAPPTNTAFDSSSVGSMTTTAPTTTTACRIATMVQLCEKLQVSSQDNEALEELGMLGLSLDAFCSGGGDSGGPGKFALYQILQSVGISTPTCRALIEGAFAERGKTS